MTLRLRLALTYAALVTLIVAAFAVVLFAAMGRALGAEMDRRLEVRASQVQLTIWSGTESLTADDISSAHLDLSPLTALNAPTLYVQVLGRDGTVVARSANLQAEELPVNLEGLLAALEGERSFGDVEVEDNPVRILSVPILAGGRVTGVLQVGQSRLPLRQALEELAALLLVLGVAAALIGGAVSWWAAGRALNPLQTMAQRAEDIATEGNFSHRVGPVRQGDEIGQLAATVDHLLDTVEATLRRHREFVADTSHELRNPLLAIRANLELLQKLDDPAAKAECVEEASAQIERMSRLVSDLLLLARSDARQMVQRRLIAVHPIVRRIVGEARHRAGDRVIAIDRCDPVFLRADEGRVAQMLVNLLDNAIQHTHSDGNIAVSLQLSQEWARITVKDDGEGIASDDIGRIFERFYRARASGQGVAQGTGLGLAIVKHLAEAHGGDVTVESTIGVGSAFTIRLPVTLDQPTTAAESEQPRAVPEAART
jgi:signal transduction histidine kinase